MDKWKEYQSVRGNRYQDQGERENGERPYRNAGYECNQSMVVDPNHIKFIIGKGGIKIREIESSCDVKLQIDKKDNNVKISGATIENINKAIAVIKKVTSGGEGNRSYKNDYECSKSVVVDPIYIKYIIGRRGRKIREIESSCDVKLQIDKNDNNVKIFGATLENINKAIDVIEDAAISGAFKYEPQTLVKIYSLSRDEPIYWPDQYLPPVYL